MNRLVNDYLVLGWCGWVSGLAWYYALRGWR